MNPFELPLEPVLVFLVVLSRAGGLVTFAPFWAHASVSMQIRTVTALILALILTPILLHKIPTPPSDIYSLGVVLVVEIAIGMLIGYVGRVIFTGFEMAAHFLSNQMGFALAGIIDPTTNAQTTTFGIGAQMLSIIVFLGMNGHHWFLIATFQSFDITGAGTFSVSGDLVLYLIQLVGSVFAIGLSLAAPAIIVLVVMEFGLEFFGRTAPQFQVFILGFPLKIGLGLTILGTTVYFLPSAFRTVLIGIGTSLESVLSFI